MLELQRVRRFLSISDRSFLKGTQKHIHAHTAIAVAGCVVVAGRFCPGLMVIDVFEEDAVNRAHA